MWFTSVTLTISYRLTFVNPIFIKNAAFSAKKKAAPDCVRPHCVWRRNTAPKARRGGTRAGPCKTFCHPISLVLPKETGVAPQRKTPAGGRRRSTFFLKYKIYATWSSREVNDVSHQNRALLPLVAALTGKLMRPSPRSGALPPHAVWPRAKRSKRTVGDAINSFTLQDDLFLPFRGPWAALCHRPLAGLQAPPGYATGRCPWPQGAVWARHAAGPEA